MKRFVVPAVLTALTLAAAPPAHAARSWTARLSGGQESPAVKSKISGSATVRLVAFGDSSAHYLITTSSMSDVTMAHLHSGAKGENGPIVVTLQTPEKKGSRMVSQGTIHASDLSGPLAGKTLADFAASCDSGNVYVNVHTQSHPDGEVRGQLHKGAGGGGTARKKSAAK